MGPTSFHICINLPSTGIDHWLNHSRPCASVSEDRVPYDSDNGTIGSSCMVGADTVADQVTHHIAFAFWHTLESLRQYLPSDCLRHTINSFVKTFFSHVHQIFDFLRNISNRISPATPSHQYGTPCILHLGCYQNQYETVRTDVSGSNRDFTIYLEEITIFQDNMTGEGMGNFII